MGLRFLSGKQALTWIVLFISAVGLAIALSHTLHRPAPVSVANSAVPAESSSEFEAEAGAVSPLQIQTRYDRQLAHYATVSRSDGSFRRMFVEAGAIATIQPGQPLPDGTLIAMETWYSPQTVGTVFVKQKQGGEWRYGSFSPDRPDYQMGFSGSCHRCHSPFPDTDFTLTKPLLEAALSTQQVQTAWCDRPGRTPCAPSAYRPQTS